MLLLLTLLALLAPVKLSIQILAFLQRDFRKHRQRLLFDIRSNLLALQNTANLLDTANTALSTGKKVNSALDNATSYFTSQNLSDRATNLNTLQDGITNGLNTLKAANQGIQTITSLLKSAKAIAQSALSGSGGTTSYSATSATAQTTGTGTSLTAIAGSSKVASVANGVTAGDTLTFQSTNATSGVVSSYTFNVTGTSTINDLVSAVNASGVATAKINDNGTLSFNSNGNLTVTDATAGVTSTATSILGFDTTATPGVIGTTSTTTAAGTDYTSQFNDLLTSIDQTANDSSYNGVNLLVGGSANQLSVKFDDTSGSHLDVDSQNVTTGGLGVSQAVTLNASNAQSFIDSIDTALTSVQNLAGTYGTKQTIMQSRADFTSSMSTILQSGSDALVTADTNEEAADVLALQTRQSLSQSALSLANSANQAVLQLLR